MRRLSLVLAAPPPPAGVSAPLPSADVEGGRGKRSGFIMAADGAPLGGGGDDDTSSSSSSSSEDEDEDGQEDEDHFDSDISDNEVRHRVRGR